MARREVDLVIRARNEADRAIKSVSSALDGLRKAQNSVQTSSMSADSALGMVAATMRELNRSVDAGKIMGELRKQRQVVTQAKQSYESLRNEATRLGRELANTEKPTRKQTQAFEAARKAALGAEKAYLSKASAASRLKQSAVQTGASVKALQGQAAELSNQIRKTGDRFTQATPPSRSFKQAIMGVQAAASATTVQAARTGNQVRSTGNAARGAGMAMGQAATQGHRLKDAFRGVYGEGRSAMSFMQRMRGELLAATTAAFGFYAAINQIGQVLGALMTIEAIENRLGAVFEQDAVRTAREMEYLEAQARRLGIEFGVLGNQYAQFAIAADVANFSSEGIRQTFMAVAEAGRVMKLSNEQIEGTFYAIQQMISKGKIQSEELRRQLGDRLPGAFQFMAEAIGVTTAELDAMLERGEVIADESTLVAFAEVLTDRFGAQLPEALDSTRTAIGRFENSILQARRQVAEAGFDEAFKDALNEITAFMESDDASQAFEAIGSGLAKIVGLLPGIVQNFDAFVKLAAVFLGYRLGTALIGVAGIIRTRFRAELALATTQVNSLGQSLVMTAARAQGPFRAGIFSAAAALGRFRVAARAAWAAVGMLGGPMGIAIALGVMAATEIFGRLATRVDIASSALRLHERQIGRVQEAYEEAAGDAAEFTAALKTMNAAEISAGMNQVTTAMRNLRREGLRATSREIRRITRERSRGTGILTDSDTDVIRQLQEISLQFYRAEISADEYRTAVGELQKAGAGFADEFILGLRDLVEGSEGGEEGLRHLERASVNYENTLRLMSGEMSHADWAASMLSESLDDVARSADTSALDEYTVAVRELREAIGELEAMDKFRDDMVDLRTARDSGLAAVRSDPEAQSEPALMAAGTANVEQNYEAAVAAARREFLNSIDYRDIIDRTAVGADDETRRQAEEQLRSIAAELLERGMDVTRENILAAQIGGGVDNIDAGRGEARSTLATTDIEVDRARDAADERERMAEAQANFNQSLEAANERATYERSILGESREEQQVLLAIYDAQADAQRQNLSLTEAQIAAIRQRVEDERKIAAIQETRNEQEKMSSDDIVAAYESRRQMLQDQVEFLQDIGEGARADELLLQLEATNEQLLAAIENAIAFHMALGGANAENSILRLQGLKDQIEASGRQAIVSGRQINDQLAGGAANAFDQFAQAVANGENAFKSLADAFRQFAADFLRQIAQMIIKQMILNALGGGGKGGGGGVGGFISKAVNAGVAHDGGMIGAARPSRSVAAGYFSNAMRHHSGGVIGLKPNERPIIAEVGEEMLTADDPRHRNNGGGVQKPPNVSVYNVLDPADIMSKALGTPEGEATFVNFMRRNKDAIGGAVG